MKVIILCGGIGTRLKEETEYKPKAMVYIGNKPLIWHVMKTYAHYGFNEFILALGYKADYIKDFFLNQKALTTDFTLDTKTQSTKFHVDKMEKIDNFKITFVDTGLKSLTGERILRCKKYIPHTDKNFMVAYGDCVANIDIKKVLNLHLAQKTLGTTTGVHPRTKFGRMRTNKNHIVTSFEEKPPLSDWVNGGYMVFKKEFFDFIKKEEMDHETLHRLALKRQLSFYQHDDFWFAIDTYKELEDLNNFWNTNYRPWVVWK